MEKVNNVDNNLKFNKIIDDLNELPFIAGGFCDRVNSRNKEIAYKNTLMIKIILFFTKWILFNGKQNVKSFNNVNKLTYELSKNQEYTKIIKEWEKSDQPCVEVKKYSKLINYKKNSIFDNFINDIITMFDLENYNEEDFYNYLFGQNKLVQQKFTNIAMECLYFATSVQ